MAVKVYEASWMGQYKGSSNTYYGGGSPVRVGSPGDQWFSYIGIPTSVRTAIKDSTTSPTLSVRMHVTNGAEFKFGAHKETYDKGSGTKPWYANLNLNPNWGTGWQQQDLTNAFMNDYKNGVYHGIMVYGGDDYGEALNTGATRIEFTVTGEWNDPPNKPTITYPKGGEIVDAGFTAKWTKPTDPDGDTLSYQIAFYDGSTWEYYTTSQLSYYFVTSDEPETANAKFAVRSYDGKVYSDFVYSQPFTINHNQAPKEPTLYLPQNGSTEERAEVIRFTWKHNDDGIPAGYRLAWRLKGTSTWTYVPASGFTNSTAQYYHMPANTLPAGEIEWTVQTKDQQGAQSIFAPYKTFLSANASTAPVIITPSNGAVWSLTNPEIKWSSLNQLEYEVLLKDSSGATVWSVSGVGSTKSVYPNYMLANNATYTVSVRAKDSTTFVWSPWRDSTFTTSFTPPAKPQVYGSESAGEGITNVLYRSLTENIPPPLSNAKWTKVAVGNQTIIGDYSFTSGTSGAGYEIFYTKDELPLEQGNKYKLSAVMSIQGGRIYLAAWNEAGATLSSVMTPITTAQSVAGFNTIELTIPANTYKMRVVVLNNTDSVGMVTYSDISLVASSSTPTTSIDVYRREYTPTDSEPWIKVAENLSTVGSFLDYTLASNVPYEFKVRAKAANGTETDSSIYQLTTTFESAFLQEAHNLSGINILTFATSRDEEVEIENELSSFAGRQDPVREFGEHEQIVLSIEWEVDTYAEVRAMRELLRKRDILLYRDGVGRRLWCTTGELSIQDRDVYGFVLSTELTQTSFEEDLTVITEGEMI